MRTLRFAAALSLTIFLMAGCAAPDVHPAPSATAAPGKMTREQGMVVAHKVAQVPGEVIAFGGEESTENGHSLTYVSDTATYVVDGLSRRVSSISVKMPASTSRALNSGEAEQRAFLMAEQYRPDIDIGKIKPELSQTPGLYTFRWAAGQGGTQRVVIVSVNEDGTLRSFSVQGG